MLTEALPRLEDLPGVGPITAKQLRLAGYYTIKSIAVAPSRELVEKVGLSGEKALSLSKEARKMLQIHFQTAEELLELRKEITRITTSSVALDNLLGGGAESKAILELIGEYGVGKTQICLTLCVTVQLPVESGGLEGGALYIDSEGSFRPERIIEIAHGHGLEPSKILSNIIVARAFNSDHQILIIEKASEIVKNKNIKLLIVDSVISHFRSEYIGRQSLPERQQKLNRHLHRLMRMAELYNLSVVVTNQVVADPAFFFGPSHKPAGGHIIAHLSTNRIFIRKSKKNLRIARIIDSPYLPEMECLFKISDRGIEDVTA